MAFNYQASPATVKVNVLDPNTFSVVWESPDRPVQWWFPVPAPFSINGAGFISAVIQPAPSTFSAPQSIAFELDYVKAAK